MLPVACLPAAGILYGIGYWMDSAGYGTNSVIAAFLINAGAAILNNLPLLFAIGVAVGMSEDQNGTSALAGMVAFLTITTLLSTDAVAMYRNIDVSEVSEAFHKISNAFTGILSGLLGAVCYNHFKDVHLPDWLSFFSGRRSVAIVTAAASVLTAGVLYFVWPLFYSGLVDFGKVIAGLGPFGAGIFAIANRALIPFGLHHALNAVFWFDTADINDLGLFWSGAKGAVKGVTGQYMTGYFPVMMFGLPGGALAMYHCAKDKNKKKVAALLLAGSAASFFTGITEPLEFSFMFLAPGLYFLHAVLAGICSFVCAMLPFRIGFNFSAGLIDWVLSFKAPMALNPWLLLPIGLVTGVVYYVVFRLAITIFQFKTPGREEEEDDDDDRVLHSEEKKETKRGNHSGNEFVDKAEIILKGLGGKENIQELDHCATRLRVEVLDSSLVNVDEIKRASIPGVIRPSENTIQVIVGTKVQFVFDEMKRIMK